MTAINSTSENEGIRSIQIDLNLLAQPIQLELPVAKYIGEFAEQIQQQIIEARPMVIDQIRMAIAAYIRSEVPKLIDGLVSRRVAHEIDAVIDYGSIRKAVRDAVESAAKRAASELTAQAKRSKKTPFVDMPLHELELTVRALNVLRGEGIETVGQLVQRTETDLLKMDGMGRVSLNEVIAKLRARNLKLGSK